MGDMADDFSFAGRCAPMDGHELDELTYDEWNELGYFVIKGEKSKKKNDKGIALFNRDQVEEAYEIAPPYAYLDDDWGDRD